MNTMRDACLLICFLIASWAETFLPAHLLDNSQLSCVIPSCSAAWLLPAVQHDLSQLRSMIIACWLCDSCLLFITIQNPSVTFAS